MQTFTPSQIWQQYKQLLAQMRAGRISRAQFTSQVQQLRAQDQSGVWWAINPGDGSFLRYDGQRWVSGRPPEYTPAMPAPAVPAGRAMSGARTKKPPSRWRAIIPFLGLILSVSCGVLWALYTTLRVGQGEPVDYLTPILMIAIPVGFWVFRKPLDTVMRPVASARNVVPRPMLIGAAFALPLVTGLACSSLGTAGYGAMRWTVLVSILGAYLLTYNPEASK